MQTARLFSGGLVLAASLTGCASMGSLMKKVGFSEPTVEITGVHVLQANLEGVELGFFFQANNPNPIGLNVERIEYEVFLDGKTLGSGSNPNPIALPARGASAFSVNYAVSTKEVLGAGLSALGKKEHTVAIKATLGVNTPIGVLDFSLEHEEALSF